MEIRPRFPLAIAFLCLFWISGFASIPSRDSLGIAPQDLSYYKSNVIKCKDGSKKFTREQLNDEFCDCPDGTDEPGTSACPEGRFYCQNVGHIPLSIFSSRVNDGICDCCDGSDEYNSNTKCPNTCWEAGKAARERLKKKIATFKEGVTIRNKEVEKAKEAFDKEEAELSKLKGQEKILEGLVQKLKEQKEKIEKAEEEDRLKKEKEDKRLKEEEEKRLKESENKANDQEKPSEDSSHDTMEGAPDESTQQHVAEHHDDTIVNYGTGDDASTGFSPPSNLEVELAENQDDTVAKAQMNPDGITREAAAVQGNEKEQEASDATEELSKEELGRLVASRWIGENTEPNEAKSTVTDQEPVDIHDTSDTTQEEDHAGYTSEIEEDRDKYQDDEDFEDSSYDEDEDHLDANGAYNPDEDDKIDFSDFTASTSTSWLDKIQQTVQNLLQTFNIFKTPVDTSEADHVRKEYDDSNLKLSKLRSRISSLTEKSKQDFGKEKEFYSFYGNCFEHKQNKYTYDVCPYKQANQREGHSTTQLGSWEKFDDSYRAMQFSHGDKCWNGPDRSIKVRLRCGLKNELTDVDEPSRCEYVALLSTPAVCVEEKLKELQEKLEQLNSIQPPSHDEL